LTSKGGDFAWLRQSPEAANPACRLDAKSTYLAEIFAPPGFTEVIQ